MAKHFSALQSQGITKKKKKKAKFMSKQLRYTAVSEHHSAEVNRDLAFSFPSAG